MMGSGSLFPQNLPGDEGVLGCRWPGALLFLATTSRSRSPQPRTPCQHPKGKALLLPLLPSGFSGCFTETGYFRARGQLGFGEHPVYGDRTEILASPWGGMCRPAGSAVLVSLVWASKLVSPVHPQKPLRGQLPPAPGLWQVTVGQGYRQRGVPHPAACTRSIPVGQGVRAARQAAGQAAPAGQAKSSRLVTSQRGLSPEPVSHLHVVVPAQPASVEVQGGEVQDDLKLGTGGGREWGEPPPAPRGGLRLPCSAVPGASGPDGTGTRSVVMPGSIPNRSEAPGSGGCWG